MQRVAKENQTGNSIGFRRRDLRSDAPAHRFSADDQTILFQLRVLERSLDHRAKAGFKSRLRIREAPLLFGIEKVESHRVNSAFGQTTGEHTHETAQLIRARAMT